MADGAHRCERFEVYVDGVLMGETSGEGPRDNYKCDAVEKCMKEGADFAYFTLPRGESFFLFTSRFLSTMLSSIRLIS